MKEIKTRIDDVFEFVTTRKKTTLRELSREFNLKREDLEKYTNVLSEYDLIKVKYGLFNTYLYTEEDNAVQLIKEFKSLLYLESTNDMEEFDKDEVKDKSMKITAR